MFMTSLHSPSPRTCLPARRATWGARPGVSSLPLSGTISHTLLSHFSALSTFFSSSGVSSVTGILLNRHRHRHHHYCGSPSRPPALDVCARARAHLSGASIQSSNSFSSYIFGFFWCIPSAPFAFSLYRACASACPAAPRGRPHTHSVIISTVYRRPSDALSVCLSLSRAGDGSRPIT
ncbi:hypothetical protein BC628DRAFT_303417 [Trametes gibbosa]|nr:hypothetical protein BC628DRAFT_303417 [Trametes gibbosa]